MSKGQEGGSHVKGHEQGAGDVLFLDLGSGYDECVYFAVVHRYFI